MAIKTSKRNNIRTSRRLRTAVAVISRREPKAATVSYNTAPTTAGAVAHVNAIAQGDGLGDRSGDKIWIEHLEIGFNQLSTATNNTRFIILRDAFSQGSAPAVTDILSNAGVSAPHNSLYVTQQKRFRILFDHCTSSSLNGTLAHTFFNRHKIVNQASYYTGVNATDEASGALYLLVITDVATSSAIDFKIKMVYSDY